MIEWLIILLSIVIANLPWLSNKLFLVVEVGNKKSLAWVLTELICLYLVWGLVLMFIENQVVGNIHNQDWEFYVVTFCLFIIFTFPGFIYKVIWK
jgi:hypothetical protein